MRRDAWLAFRATQLVGLGDRIGPIAGYVGMISYPLDCTSMQEAEAMFPTQGAVYRGPWSLKVYDAKGNHIERIRYVLGRGCTFGDAEARLRRILRDAHLFTEDEDDAPPVPPVTENGEMRDVRTEWNDPRVMNQREADRLLSPRQSMLTRYAKKIIIEPAWYYPCIASNPHPRGLDETNEEVML